MSAASAKSLAAKKLKRQKLFIVVGSVALLAILGFQLPKLLGGGSKATTTVTTSPAVTGSATTPSLPPGELPDTDRLVVQRNSNQLLSFGLFKSKDPFVQQIVPKVTASAPPAPAAPTKTTKPARPVVPLAPIGLGLTPVTTTTTSSPPSAANPPTSTSPTGTGSPPPSTTPSVPTSVLISTNGLCETVALKGTFPQGEDIFRVVSIAKNGKSVEIAVVGGSYDSGQATATLKLGSKPTLVNTADGTRYVISLQAKCSPTQEAAGNVTTTASTSPASTTPVPATPAPAAAPPATTTPIVTDSLDTNTTPFG